MRNEKSHGGKRAGSGRKKKAPASYISFRVSLEEKQKLSEAYGKDLHKLFKIWIDQLLRER